MSEDMPMASYIWDISERNDPLMELRAMSPLICCQYNQKNADWQLAFWIYLTKFGRFNLIRV